MRLREPFAGYFLTSGHYLFHIAFFIGTFLPLEAFDKNSGSTDALDEDDSEKAKFVF